MEQRNAKDNSNLFFNSPSILSFSATEEKFKKSNSLIRFHYTSASALLSILSDKPTLRFTDIRFMNDHSEMVYCVKSLFDFLSDNEQDYPFCSLVADKLLLNNCTRQDYSNLSVSHVEFADNPVYPYLSTRNFVFCMSDDGDSLNMWNYYVHNGKYEGYNIGFDVYKFLKSFDTDKKATTDPVVFRYGKVLYTPDAQKKEIKSLVDWIERDRYRKGDTAVADNMIYLRHYIESYGAFFKHESFKNEKEYRIVLEITENRINQSRDHYYNENMKRLSLRFYERNGVLVPYMEVPINKDSVKTITISPIIEANLATQSLMELLNMNGYSSGIAISAIPIRF